VSHTKESSLKIAALRVNLRIASLAQSLGQLRFSAGLISKSVLVGDRHKQYTHRLPVWLHRGRSFPLTRTEALENECALEIASGSLYSRRCSAAL
jgi:hypothetical protein